MPKGSDQPASIRIRVHYQPEQQFTSKINIQYQYHSDTVCKNKRNIEMRIVAYNHMSNWGDTESIFTNCFVSITLHISICNDDQLPRSWKDRMNRSWIRGQLL